MPNSRRSLLLLLGLGVVSGAQGQATKPATNTLAESQVRDSTRAIPRQFQPADLAAWRSIRSASLSADGKWLAYQLVPNEGDGEVVIRPTGSDGKELRFPIGEFPSPGGGAGATAGPPVLPAASLVISGDSKWLAFTVYPTAAESRAARQNRRTLHNKAVLVNLGTTEKREFEKVRRFSFNGDHATWLALQSYPADAPSAPPAGGGANAPSSATTRGPEGTDLVLVDLRSPEGEGSLLNVGNVGEFAFDPAGAFLAYTIDARDQTGNGVQLRDLKTDVVRPLDGERALYRRLAWSDTLQALSVLRGRVDSAARDTSYSVVGITDLAKGSPKKTVLEPKDHGDFPAGMVISPDRSPRWSEDLAALFFGIRVRKKAVPRGEEARPVAAVQPGAPGGGGTINQPTMGRGGDDELPSLVLWHWKDPRLQPQQIVEESRDKGFNFLTEYRVAENRVIRLADDSVRNVTILAHDRYAYGADTREYDQAASSSGRRFWDLYAIDLKTGARRLVLKKMMPGAWPAPDGRQVMYYGPDPEFHLLDLASGETRDFTKGSPVSFADLEDDHNNLVAPPNFPIGWSRDASAVLLSDGWDVWKVPARTGGAAAVNLTGDGKSSRTHYQRRYVFDPKEKGIDLAKPQYFATYAEWTKQEGLAIVEPGKPGARRLRSEDARLGFLKAKDADTFLYTRQTYTEFPNYYLAGSDFKSGTRLTDANPQQKDFAWSRGTKLINYVSDKGDSLQAALYLPAGYQPGKQYPLLVTIYEKRSQNLHGYRAPNETSAPNPTLYTSRGYAVLDPDIVYRVNDPGMSAVWCVIPAVKAAIATGVVDPKNVGLWGHSWGGYQTAFLVTQTSLFKAAIAGAPLTDLVSMYSSIYWNTGGTNQAIFEASQGRFRGNFTDNYDAYIRNSPVFQAKNVTTPLLLLHNDKDGAVDFNQGVTYFNTLRQLGKEVVLLEYVGENHGLAKPVNQKDYAVRMQEWFDTYLKGAPAPDWMKDGIPRLKMEEHLKSRQKKPEPPKKVAGLTP